METCLKNSGYFCRHAAISGLVAAFLSRVAKNSTTSSSSALPPRSQIVSLGAGSDTLFFRLHAAGRAPSLYVELDLPEVVSRKAAIVAATPELAASVGLPPHGPASSSPPPQKKKLDRIVTPRYALLPCDLRAPSPISTAIRRAQQEEEEEDEKERGPPASTASSAPDNSGAAPRFFFDPAAPTLFVSECVLVYLPPEAGDEVLRDAFEILNNGEGGGEGGESGSKNGGGAEGAVIVYDPCRPATAFGRQMAANLRARGCELLGIAGATDPEGAAARLRRAGWESPGNGGDGDGEGGQGSAAASAAADLRAVWERLLSREARALASRVELLDELEEFNLIMEHYFLAVGVKKKKRKDGEGISVLEGFGLASLAEL